MDTFEIVLGFLTTSWDISRLDGEPSNRPATHLAFQGEGATPGRRAAELERMNGDPSGGAVQCASIEEIESGVVLDQ